jgi:hypothetical protein
LIEIAFILLILREGMMTRYGAAFLDARATVGMTILLGNRLEFSSTQGTVCPQLSIAVHSSDHQQNCHPDRSALGFPATLQWRETRVRLSVKKGA